MKLFFVYLVVFSDSRCVSINANCSQSQSVSQSSRTTYQHQQPIDSLSLARVEFCACVYVCTLMPLLWVVMYANQPEMVRKKLQAPLKMEMHSALEEKKKKGKILRIDVRPLERERAIRGNHVFTRIKKTVCLLYDFRERLCCRNFNGLNFSK